MSSPADPDRPNNLWEPVDDQEDHGAPGVFDDRARSWSAELWARLNWGKLALGGVGVGLSGLLTGLLIKANKNKQVR